jgi:type VI protein secretion system component VasF
MASRGTRYSTEEERKHARAETNRRYREKQRNSITSQPLTNPEVERLESELTLITNKYRHQSDHLESLAKRVEVLESQFSTSTVTKEHVQELRDKVVAELERLDNAIKKKGLPPSVIQQPRT